MIVFNYGWLVKTNEVSILNQSETLLGSPCLDAPKLRYFANTGSSSNSSVYSNQNRKRFGIFLVGSTVYIMNISHRYTDLKEAVEIKARLDQREKDEEEAKNKPHQENGSLSNGVNGTDKEHQPQIGKVVKKLYLVSS